MIRKRPRVLLMGLRRSGKSSVAKVVFHRLSPNETLFLESTGQVGKDDIMSFVDFQLWDIPGHVDFAELGAPEWDRVFEETNSIVFVIDVQDDYIEALQRLYLTVNRAVRVNPGICFEVLLHKIEGLSDDQKLDTERDVQQRIMDELGDTGLDSITMNFYLTSIYDLTIFEAFSKIVQRLIAQLPSLENLLNGLCVNCGIDKTFIFDVSTKVYLATDSSPVDFQSYEVCSDMIDVVLDVGAIYSQPITPRTTPQEPAAMQAVIRLSHGHVLWMRELTQHLALICILRQESYEKNGFIEYNFKVVRDAICTILALNKNTEEAPTSQDSSEGYLGIDPTKLTLETDRGSSPLWTSALPNPQSVALLDSSSSRPPYLKHSNSSSPPPL